MFSFDFMEKISTYVSTIRMVFSIPSYNLPFYLYNAIQLFYKLITSSKMIYFEVFHHFCLILKKGNVAINNKITFLYSTNINI